MIRLETRASRLAKTGGHLTKLGIDALLSLYSSHRGEQDFRLYEPHGIYV